VSTQLPFTSAPHSTPTVQINWNQASLDAMGDTGARVTPCQCHHQLRAVCRTRDLTVGRRLAEQVLESFDTRPIAEVARLGRTLRRWREQLLGYVTTDRASNGGTDAINGITELHQRIARGYRNRHDYRSRMLLVAGGPLLPPELR
jgi:hypothetical protein